MAGKDVNVKQATLVGGIRKGSNHCSPIKKSQVGIDYALRHSPVRNLTVTSNKGTPRKGVSDFTFHEETPSEKAAVLMEHFSLKQQCAASNDENDYNTVKENMSPSKLAKRVDNNSTKNSKRIPLRDLSIEDHKGYIVDPHTHEETTLTLHYKYKTKLPTYVTPPRDKKLRQYFTYSDIKEGKPLSRSTDDISKDKIVKKLDFTIRGN